MDYDKIEEQQEETLPSEYEEKEDELRETYQDYLKRNGYVQDWKSEDERLDQMKHDALSLYEEGLNNGNIPFGQRRQVADKVLEITGVIPSKKDKENGGNTFVFSEKFAERFMNVAEKMKDSMNIEETGDKEDDGENKEIRDTRDVTPTSNGS